MFQQGCSREDSYTRGPAGSLLAMLAQHEYQSKKDPSMALSSLWRFCLFADSCSNGRCKLSCSSHDDLVGDS